jgi:hypothetical protein
MKALENMIILIVFAFFFGCAENQLIRSEEELVDREAEPLRSELGVRIVSKDEQGLSLSAQIKNIAFVRDSVRVEGLYVHGSKREGSIVGFFGAVMGYAGGLGGCFYVKSQSYDWFPTEGQLGVGCLISGVSCLTGLAIVSEANSRGSEFTKVLPGFIKTDTVCVDSLVLVKQKVKVLIGNTDLEKEYYTDEYGNVKLKFNEIIPAPTNADSVLDLIIRYYDLVDTVEVKRL